MGVVGRCTAPIEDSYVLARAVTTERTVAERVAAETEIRPMATFAVTGTASGIGAATAARLVEDGHRVVGVDLHDADVIADLASPEGRESAIAGVLERCDGNLAGLVPCAGVGGTSSSELTVRLNYFGTMALVAGLRDALVAGGGTLVLVSSNSTTMTPGLSVDDADVYLAGDEEAAVRHFAEGGWMAYPAGKLAIAFWVRANAAAWLADGIRINAVAPGVIRTGMTEFLTTDPQLMAALDQIPIPAGRWGRPEEIAEAIAFLASDRSSYVVGQTLFVDGGTDALLQPRSHPHPLPAR